MEKNMEMEKVMEMLRKLRSEKEKVEYVVDMTTGLLVKKEAEMASRKNGEYGYICR